MANETPKAKEKKVEKCDYCEGNAIMQMTNLQDGISHNMCQRHFGDFVTQGKALVMQQFAEAVRHRAGMF